MSQVVECLSNRSTRVVLANSTHVWKWFSWDRARAAQQEIAWLREWHLTHTVPAVQVLSSGMVWSWSEVTSTFPWLTRSQWNQWFSSPPSTGWSWIQLPRLEQPSSSLQPSSAWVANNSKPSRKRKAMDELSSSSSIKRIKTQDALPFALEMVHALAELHTQELVHGDIHPDNLFWKDSSSLVREKLVWLDFSEAHTKLPVCSMHEPSSLQRYQYTGCIRAPHLPMQGVTWNQMQQADVYACICSFFHLWNPEDEESFWNEWKHMGMHIQSAVDLLHWMHAHPLVLQSCAGKRNASDHKPSSSSSLDAADSVSLRTSSSSTRVESSSSNIEHKLAPLLARRCEYQSVLPWVLQYARPTDTYKQLVLLCKLAWGWCKGQNVDWSSRKELLWCLTRLQQPPLVSK